MVEGTVSFGSPLGSEGESVLALSNRVMGTFYRRHPDSSLDPKSRSGQPLFGRGGTTGAPGVPLGPEGWGGSSLLYEEGEG